MLTASLILAGLLFLFDFQNVLSWQRRRVLVPLPSARSEDYTIVIPLYGHPRYFAERHELLPYRDRVLVAMDQRGELMPAFADELEAEGWHVFRTIVGGPGAEMPPGPPSLVLAALEAGVIKTSYVVRMDADTSVIDDLSAAVAVMQKDGADLASVKVLVRNRSESLPARIQGLEYDMAMLSRHYRPWLASGACFVARTTALHAILRMHTMSYLGEDVETGRIAQALRMRVRHLDLRVETDAPASWAALFRQRRIWWAGNFRHAILNFDRNLAHTPWWAIYYIGLVWVGVYFKTASIAVMWQHPGQVVLVLPLLLGVYALVTLVSNLQVRSPLMAAYPLYALVQSILMPVIGLFWYLWLLRTSKKPGRYRFGYRRKTVMERLGFRPCGVAECGFCREIHEHGRIIHARPV